MKNDEDLLLLNQQLCFPIYACARKIVAAYHPFLQSIGLTYTQYVTMMVLWEKKEISVRDLGYQLYLDSGTLTPVLKKLERLHYIERRRSTEDERVVNVILTEAGLALKEQAKQVPEQMGCYLEERGIALSEEELHRMKAQFYEILERLR